jgi:SAM-dependent MidA family methyltransferase
MTPSILDFLRNKIEIEGPLKISDYMRYRLYSPEIGYYFNRIESPLLGSEGDFVTSPELSPLFGEMIAVWIMERWIELEKPFFALVEWGPGRGYLMADILRTFQVMPEIFSLLSVHLVETSPFLTTLQQKRLSSLNHCRIQWHTNEETLPWENALIGIGNEFLDAFPVDQWIKTQKGWAERRINFKNETLHWEEGTLVNPPLALKRIIKEEAAEGDIIEFSEEAYQFVQRISEKLQYGSFLFIDYGSLLPEIGNTLQALRKHQFVSVLDTSCIFDLTAHVPFSIFNTLAQTKGLILRKAVTQATFLQDLGILKRALVLQQKAVDPEIINYQLYRLLNSVEMGSLFKVVEWRKEK